MNFLVGTIGYGTLPIWLTDEARREMDVVFGFLGFGRKLGR